MTKSMKRIHNVTVRRINDCNPDTSYLEQEGFEKRLDEYNRGHFEFVGIRAEAEVSFPTSPNYALIQRVTSGGLWGIESDSSEEYLQEIEQEELRQLREQLHAMGFSKRAISAAFADVRV